MSSTDVSRGADDAGDREQELRRRLLESRRRNNDESRPSRSRSPSLQRRSPPPYIALAEGAPRPHTDRWVPPPREDRERDDQRYSPRRSDADRGQRRERYFDSDPSHPPRQGENGAEYGQAQWRRLPRDTHASTGGGEGSFFSSRNEQRKQSTLSIWPPSPTAPYIDSEEEREKERQERRKRDKERRRDRHDKSYRSRHSRSSRHDSTRHDDRDRHRSAKHDRSDRHKRESSSRVHRRHDSDTSDSEMDDKRRSSSRKHVRSSRDKRDDSSRKRRRSRSVSSSTSSDVSDAHDRRQAQQSSRRTRSPSLEKKEQAVSSDSDVEVGPSLPKTAEGKVIDARSYGGALLPGEGTAMASYVQDGKRIPRRGEIGLTSDQIEHFEKAGYVMSGSRHARMNAVRMRKENQVISAEEKRSMLRLQAEEKQKKEREIVSQFKELVDTLQPPSNTSTGSNPRRTA